MNGYIETLQKEYQRVLEKDGQSVADSAIPRYNAIQEYHAKYREGQITVEELATAVDEIICW